jgi:CRISPR-associated protein Cas1
MYARRLGEIMPHRDITVLRGIEGARVKALYARLATKHGIEWKGRRYDRTDPSAADAPNQAINHAASAVEGAAAIAVTATATIPQLGFIHEDSGQSFVLDVADLFRDSVTVPSAFRAVRIAAERPGEPIERIVRRLTGQALRRHGVIPAMIDAIKALLADSSGGRVLPTIQTEDAGESTIAPLRAAGEATASSDPSAPDACSDA